MFKSGFVTVVGRSNVGKSTLLNHIMEQKLSIVTNKAQTTRSRIQLIFTNEEMQVIFIDTPGIQKPKNKLGEYMLDISESALKDVDIITYVVDISDTIGENENYILE
ncbi:MAG: GTPase Era, partial [Gallicola sp.]|nr:GTPase Era [Gallicola sp.]